MKSRATLWVSVCIQEGNQALQPIIHKTFAELLADYSDADAIGVDIPIGLSRTGSRACDVAARKLLGRGRASSVFPTPHPDILHASNYPEAVALSRSKAGKGVSQQTFAIFDKIAEVNAIITAESQNRIFEVHPEVSFWSLAGRSMVHPKGHLAGYQERLAILQESLSFDIPDRVAAFKIARPAKPDDILDAIAAAKSAMRVVQGIAGRLPEEPELDSKGIRMEIVY